MYCKKCGSQLEPGNLFCIACGAKVESAGPQQSAPQQGGAYQPPYGGQPVYGGPRSPKRINKFLFIGIGAVLVLALAAVLIFVVFAGGMNWPLSGNTTQTKFINDSVRVFADAFSGLSNGTIEKMMSEPFDVSIDLTSDAQGVKSAGAVDIVYDNKALGFRAESEGSETKLLLLEDILYTGSYGYISGVDFNSDADLEDPMGLKDRITALAQGLSGNNEAAGSIDFRKLAEMLVNSISEDCFEKGASSTTLTLDVDDIVDTLNTFAEKLDNDKALKESIQDLLDEISPASVDITDMIQSAADYLDSASDYVELDMTFEISYENGAPVSLEVSIDEGEYFSVDFMFGYETTDSGKDIELSFTSPDGYSDFDAELSYSKTASGIEYSGSLSTRGDTMTVDGTEEWSGNEVHGEATLDIPYTGEVKLEYDETLIFGMPEENVEDDSRFEMDTSDAYITEINPLSASGLWGGITPAAPAVTEAPAMVSAAPATEAPAVTEAPVAQTTEIGIIIPTTEGEFYTALMEALNTAKDYYGFGELNIITTNYDTTLESTQFDTMIASGVDGIIMVPSSDPAMLPAMQSKAEDAGIPVVFINDNTDGTINAVSRDYDAAVSYAANACYSNVYIINAMEDIPFFKDLESKLINALGSNSSATVLGTAYTDFDVIAAEARINDMLDAFPDVNTVVCLDPVGAPGVLSALNDAGYTGNLVCLTEEYTMNQMQLTTSTVYTTYIYFPVSGIANAAMEQMSTMLNGYSGGDWPYMLSPYMY